MKESDKLNALRLIMTPKIGPITYGLLIARYGGPTEAITQAPELARRQGRDLKITSKSAALKLIEKAEAQGACLLVKGAEDYPNRLSLFDDSPVILYAKGHLSLLQKDMVAVVGARNASLNAKQLAHHWSQAIGGAGYVIVSGLARGIDRAAHIGASATGTVGVSGCGIDVIYPSENEDLYQEMFNSGLVICEAPPGTKPSPSQFPARNRIIASLARAVLVVEAAVKSGSLITAREVAERGGEVMAIPGSPTDQRALGANQLIKDGAHLVNNTDDILSILQAPISEPVFSSPPFHHQKLDDIDDQMIEKLAKDILNNLSFDAVHIDELTRQCHVSAKVIQIVLLELELAGHVERLSGNRVCKIVNFE